MKELGASVLLHSRMYEDPDYLNYQLESLQAQIGRELVAALWNSEVPVVVDLKAEESREYDPYYWDQKRLSVFARYNPVQVHNWNLEYHMAVASSTIHVPHFQYFPKDWVCKKCGCIVDGLHAPRLCDRCGAPRSAREAMLEARSYA